MESFSIPPRTTAGVSSPDALRDGSSGVREEHGHSPTEIEAFADELTDRSDVFHALRECELAPPLDQHRPCSTDHTAPLWMTLNSTMNTVFRYRNRYVPVSTGTAGRTCTATGRLRARAEREYPTPIGSIVTAARSGGALEGEYIRTTVK